MKDGGYDVKDYVGIDPLFGTLDDARRLVDEAHRLGLKVNVDFVATVLELYRRALAFRRSHAPGDSVGLAWRDAPAHVLDLSRGPGFRCVLNLADMPYLLGGEPVLTSDGSAGMLLHRDTPRLGCWADRHPRRRVAATGRALLLSR